MPGKSTNRAAFLMNCPSTVIPLFFPPVPASLAGSSQCCEPQRQTAQCCQLDLQQGVLEISGAFALLQGAPRDEDFAALWSRAGWVGLCSSGIFFVQVVCAVCVLGSSQSMAGTFAQSFGISKTAPEQLCEVGLSTSPSLLQPHGETPLMAAGGRCRCSTSLKTQDNSSGLELLHPLWAPPLAEGSCFQQLELFPVWAQGLLSLQCGASNIFLSSFFQGL